MTTQDEREQALQRLVPPHLQDTIKNYLDHGLRTGGFLEAVISNDLFAAMRRADGISRNNLHGIVQFFWNYTHSNSFGSPKTYSDWIEKFKAE